MKILHETVLPTLERSGRPKRDAGLLLLGVGVVIGFSFAIIFLSYSPSKPLPRIEVHHNHEILQYAAGPLVDVGEHRSHEETHRHENNSIKDQLYDEVRVLCWIMTGPKNHQKKAQHVVKTWGKRCNKVLVMSSAKDDKLDVVALPVEEGRKHLWAKTKEAFKYIYANHLDDADWFLKADDDTYVVVENLRYMLYPYSTDYPVYFGHRFRKFVNQGYMSGGAGYVLSKEALKRFIEIALPDEKLCRPGHKGGEDVEIGKCLENVNVTAGDSRDMDTRGRFFPFQPAAHLIPGQLPKDMWFWDFEYYKPGEGFDCCSDHAVTFHYESPNQMYVMDYLIYHLRPYGIVRHATPLPKKMTLNEMDELLQHQPPAWSNKDSDTNNED